MRTLSPSNHGAENRVKPSNKSFPIVVHSLLNLRHFTVHVVLPFNTFHDSGNRTVVCIHQRRRGEDRWWGKGKFVGSRPKIVFVYREEKEEVVAVEEEVVVEEG